MFLWEFLTSLRNHPFVGIPLVVALGASIGSFLNVVIYRLPKQLSLFWPPSQCGCGENIPWFANVPVFGWIGLRGRARCCQRRISIRYPLVELLTAALFLLAWQLKSPQETLIAWAAVSLMVALSFIDLDTMTIPDRFPFGLILVAVVVAVLNPAHYGACSGRLNADVVNALAVVAIGLSIGTAAPLWLALVASNFVEEDALGMGDVKLLGAIGALYGWQAALNSFFYGAVTCLTLTALAYGYERVRGRRAAFLPAQTHGGQDCAIGFRTIVPFGPSICIAAAIQVFSYATPLAPLPNVGLL